MDGVRGTGKGPWMVFQARERAHGWCSRHTKGPMDGVRGNIKHRVFRDVKSGKVSITNAEHFAAHADAILNGIKSLYMPIDEVLEEPEDIEKSSPRIDGTLEVHKIARSFSTDGVCKLEFFKTAVDEQPFHVQHCKKDRDPDVCGHAELPLCYNPDQTCAECHGIYAKNKEWLECNLCDQWFHEEYFFPLGFFEMLFQNNFY